MKKNFLERPIHPALPAISGEIFLFALIIFFTILSRFYDLETRVMSHDESLHTYFSWLLYKGDGYQHTPMMHGPFQFHLLALSYFIFGVSDFTARIPAVLFSIATIWTTWYWRDFLGKAGALIAGAMLLISPYMLFYGRYVRNEPYSGLAGLLMFWAILRYFQKGENRYLYWLTISLLINFTSKETAFIYAAQALLFLAFYFVWQLLAKAWHNNDMRNGFIASIAIGLLLIGGALGAGALSGDSAPAAIPETMVPANPLDAHTAATQNAFTPSATLIFAGLALLAFIAAIFFLIRGYGWDNIRKERSFDLLMLIGTLVLPMLTPFIVKAFGWSIPTTAPEIAVLETMELVRLGIIIALSFILAIGIGVWWKMEIWWKNALVFYGSFTILYTTFFTNSSGFFTGLFGSLGYWIVQQGVERGSQPWYYYAAIQIPLYEFLPALGVLLAIYLNLRNKKTSAPAETLELPETSKVVDCLEIAESPAPFDNSATFALLLWWTFSSLLAYSYAGERMPWLTYHITLPMILLSGWALGQVIERIDWQGLRERRPLLGMIAIAIFFVSLINVFSSLNGAIPPFQGKELEQLQATNQLILPILTTLASAIAIYYLLRDWTFAQFMRIGTLATFGLLTVLTARSAYRAAYINYDDATEYLVYAHGATGVKDVMAQVEDISRRTTGDLSAVIAYDASAPDTGISWPFVWYLRDYTNLRSFDAPTRSLRDSVAIIVDSKNFDKIEPVVSQGYYRSDYIRMWWPNQDYFGLITKRYTEGAFDETYSCTGIFSVLQLDKSRDYSRLCNAFTDREIRAGIFDIWLNRDFTRYAAATGSTVTTLTSWEPSDRMRLYVRKDIAAQIWSYGVVPETDTIIIDPYEENTITLTADLIFGSNGIGGGQFDAPRGIAFAPDGSFYVADSRNNRIQHFSAEGEFITAWGSFADAMAGDAPVGTFSEPWGVAVGPDGSVYVSDTWNHRVQKFDANGAPISTWGRYGLAEEQNTFWGPRGIDVGIDGRVYVADTGNKRIAVYDADGNWLTEFGEVGMDAGAFDEPTGLTVDDDGMVYVADTWNQRIQVFAPSEDGTLYSPVNEWDIAGWYGQSLDNKPFISVSDGNLFVADPEGYRVLQFSTEGEFIRTWGDYGLGAEGFGIVAAVDVDADGNVWVTDAGNNRVMRFTLPE